MAHTRRDFILRTGCAALSAAAFSAGFKQFGLMSALAQTGPDYRALVCIFLDGGNDSNNMVVPADATGYASYAAVRASSGLAIPRSALLPITPAGIGMPFGLHPSLSELQGLWRQGKLAIVSNVGPLVQPLTRAQYQNGEPTPYQLFSHSDQAEQWQTSRSDTIVQTGWGGSLADRITLNGNTPFPMIVSMDGNAVFADGLLRQPLGIDPAPTSLSQVLVLNGFSVSPEDVARRNSLEFLRSIDRSAIMVAAASDTTSQALNISQALSMDPTLSTVFPDTGLGNQLLQVARVMKLNQTAAALNLRRQIFFVTLGGFDTHQEQIGSQIQLFAELSGALNAFYDATVELQIASRVTTFTLSDFGRTLDPSGSGINVVGTDHGWGSHQIVMGGSVRGGNFYGVPGSNGTVYPTLQLNGPDDTDDRGRWIPTCAVDQYAATLSTWFGLAAADLPAVFPLIGRFTTPNLGFLA